MIEKAPMALEHRHTAHSGSDTCLELKVKRTYASVHRRKPDDEMNKNPV
jgi:hypothetical protein